MSSDENTEAAKKGDNSPVSEQEPVDELSLLKEELEDMKDKFARSMADLDNYKKRVERDREQQNLKSKGLAISSFLEVIEIIDKASNSEYPDIASAVDGMKGIHNFSKSFLQSMNVERFSPVGEQFDFRLHEALTTVIKEDIEPHTIVDVIQAGYLLEGQLLRPAKVVVSKKEEKKEQKKEEKGE
ncbi:MAG: nucleotide exchange factor GrpE [Marine Group III euryarchaeote CG-Epi3]|jgi:molecular chaperone GrpE|uniref:Protein GrpE n=1 Tax=Marine Group III euryarchaeote CG-Epi3 TaxID=1888997 RepID=A0A1J5UB92_9ARCH|nr:MAG: nucleotide exchange factor GrpE [Marine Group III euryarchaeote CG-Epi3]